MCGSESDANCWLFYNLSDHKYIACCAYVHIEPICMYVCACVQELVSRPDTDIVRNVIDKDLDRTFPSHVVFKKESG